eukprot:evm.model.scf_1520.4 EVM.evm.TU.scf_1520.4   scf_1520:24295-24636(+)
MYPSRCAARRAPIAVIFLVELAVAFVQFEPVLVPRTDLEKTSIIGTRKATYGRVSAQSFNKIARTREDHNCFEPGCTFMGEVLDITNSNVTAYDQDTLEPLAVPIRNGNATRRR